MYVSTSTSMPFSSKISMPQKMWNHTCQLFLKPNGTIWNQLKSWSSPFPYKTRNIRQNLNHGLKLLKTKILQNQKHPKSNPKYQPKNGLLQSLNQLEEHSKYHHITLKKMVCFKRQRARFCRGNRWAYFFWWFMVIYADLCWFMSI